MSYRFRSSKLGSTHYFIQNLPSLDDEPIVVQMLMGPTVGQLHKVAIKRPKSVWELRRLLGDEYPLIALENNVLSLQSADGKVFTGEQALAIVDDLCIRDRKIRKLDDIKLGSLHQDKYVEMVEFALPELKGRVVFGGLKSDAFMEMEDKWHYSGDANMENGGIFFQFFSGHSGQFVNVYSVSKSMAGDSLVFPSGTLTLTDLTPEEIISALDTGSYEPENPLSFDFNSMNIRDCTGGLITGKDALTVLVDSLHGAGMIDMEYDGEIMLNDDFAEKFNIFYPFLEDAVYFPAMPEAAPETPRNGL